MHSTSVCSVMVCLSTSLGGCGQVQPTSSPVQSWVKQHAIPLKTTNPQAPLDDVQPLQQIVGSASIVGLGEATHGSHEFFTLFAMEGSWSAGEQINTSSSEVTVS